MISREEVETLARMNRVSPYFQEKHYLMSLVLSSLYSQVSDELVFKGGTYLWFFHRLPRASEDLDFTAVGELDLDGIVDVVVADLEAYGIKAERRDETGHISFTARLAMEGPTFDGMNRNHVRLEISQRGDLSRDPVFAAFRSPYSDVPNFTVLGMDPVEVMTEKTRAMLRRSRARDMFDVHHLMGQGVGFDADLVRSKLALYGLVPSEGMVLAALERCEDAWKPELSPVIKGGPPDARVIREEVEDFLRENLL
jgi:predicted nucleotidyltransferase component of viral defense system